MKDAGSLTLNFLRSKLAPLPSYAVDFFSRRTYEGKPFTAKQAGISAIERVTPLTWSDFVEALWNEGIGGAAATLPGAAGIGVQSYTEPGGFLERAAPLLREYTRAKRQLPEIMRIKGEADEQFNARVKVFGEALEQYGVGLVESTEYRQANTATKDKMLDLLPRRISSALMKQGEVWLLRPDVLLDDAREELLNKQEREQEQQRQRVFAACDSLHQCAMPLSHRLRANPNPQHLSAKPLSHAAMMGASSASEALVITQIFTRNMYVKS